MPASEARILANQRNAQRSTGPKTPEGKERSRANSFKHGLTGAGIVLPEKDAAEVERRSITFAEELNATGDVGAALARRAALNSVRMERGADQQTASLTERVRQVEAEFVAPEGVSAEDAERLKQEAVRIAMFDPSKEANLARRYEAAAERNFFKALRELRQLQKAVQADSRAEVAFEAQKLMGSFLKMEEEGRKIDERLDQMEADLNLPPLPKPARSAYPSPLNIGCDLPFTIGRRS